MNYQLVNIFIVPVPVISESVNEQSSDKKMTKKSWPITKSSPISRHDSRAPPSRASSSISLESGKVHPLVSLIYELTLSGNRHRPRGLPAVRTRVTKVRSSSTTSFFLPLPVLLYFNSFYLILFSVGLQAIYVSACARNRRTKERGTKNEDEKKKRRTTTAETEKMEGREERREERERPGRGLEIKDDPIVIYA